MRHAPVAMASTARFGFVGHARHTGYTVPSRAFHVYSSGQYIVKPEVVAIGCRRCGHHGSTAGRDDNAVACRMDCAGRLWVAISVARSDAWQASVDARPT